MQTVEVDPSELTTIERVSLLAWHLSQGEGITVAAAARSTGLTLQGARYMLKAMSRKIPIYCEKGVWQVCDLKEILT